VNTKILLTAYESSVVNLITRDRYIHNIHDDVWYRVEFGKARCHQHLLNNDKKNSWFLCSISVKIQLGLFEI